MSAFLSIATELWTSLVVRVVPRAVPVAGNNQPFVDGSFDFNTNAFAHRFRQKPAFPRPRHQDAHGRPWLPQSKQALRNSRSRASTSVIEPCTWYNEGTPLPQSPPAPTLARGLPLSIAHATRRRARSGHCR